MPHLHCFNSSTLQMKWTAGYPALAELEDTNMWLPYELRLGELQELYFL